jgi:hypothetical protein
MTTQLLNLFDNECDDVSIPDMSISSILAGDIWSNDGVKRYSYKLKITSGKAVPSTACREGFLRKFLITKKGEIFVKELVVPFLDAFYQESVNEKIEGDFWLVLMRHGSFSRGSKTFYVPFKDGRVVTHEAQWVHGDHLPKGKPLIEFYDEVKKRKPKHEIEYLALPEYL